MRRSFYNHAMIYSTSKFCLLDFLQGEVKSDRSQKYIRMMMMMMMAFTHPPLPFPSSLFIFTCLFISMSNIFSLSLSFPAGIFFAIVKHHLKFFLLISSCRVSSATRSFVTFFFFHDYSQIDFFLIVR
mgnify:CR=1 FL=1